MLRFGDVEFDVRAGELRRGDVTTRLEPQPARVLALLLERPGEVVTRTELQQRVWNQDTFVDFERGLNYCIARIRNALGDSHTDPRFIETLPRRGYRFLAPVQEVAAAPDRPARAHPQGGQTADETPDEPGAWQWVGVAPVPADAAAPIEPVFAPAAPSSASVAPSSAPAASRSSRRLRKIWTAIVAIGFAGVATWATMARREGVADYRVRVAVALFDNETGAPENDRLAQSLTDATVAQLAGDSTRLTVIGNAPILRQAPGGRDLAAIGDALQVNHVVLGQVQQIDGRLRITTHLIRVDDQSHLWAHRFEPAPAEMDALDRTVSTAVTEAVTARLLGVPSR